MVQRSNPLLVKLLPSAANAYFHLLRSSLRQILINLAPPSRLLWSQTLLACYNFHGGTRAGRGGCGIHKKCTHCSRTYHTEAYCWSKSEKPDYVQRVWESSTTHAPQSSSTSPPSLASPNAHISFSHTQFQKLFQTMKNTTISTAATLVNPGNIACVAHTSPSSIIDFKATPTFWCNFFYFWSKCYWSSGYIDWCSTRPVQGASFLHPIPS